MRSPTRILLCLLLPAIYAKGQGPVVGSTPEAAFEQRIQPVLKEYCLDCHSTEKQKGDLDLEVFSSLKEIKRHPKIWQKVAEQLATNEMPPKKKPQPDSATKTELTSWLDQTLDEMARDRAGDPGPVVLRRLSNAEYTYTLRDLTGLGALDPAREFPADGAAGEGFTNTGQALVMSPSLVTKYLDAAKEVAAHAVLLPDGIRFSPAKTRRDWSEELMESIRAFYRDFADVRGGEKVNLQGIVFETNGDGGLPVARYLAALSEERDALVHHRKLFDEVAKERGLNAKYLKTLFTSLGDGQPSSIVLDQLRLRWKRANEADVAAVVKEIGDWQKALWKFSSVGHIGKVGGPKAWMEPVNPLTERQELKVKIPPTPAGQTVTIYLAVTDVSEAGQKALVTWERPRLVAKGKPDVLLQDIRRLSTERGLAADSGVDPRLLRTPEGVETADITTTAPALVEVRIPAELAEGCEFVTSGRLASKNSPGCVQMQVLTSKPPPSAGLVPSGTTVTASDGRWTDNNQQVTIAAPIIVNEGSPARQRFEAAFNTFRELFPAALCYTKIVPVDEVVTLTLFHREDDQLCRLMLNDEQKAKLDRMWDELHFVSQDALTLVDAFAQLWEYATQDADPKVFEPLRKPIQDRAAAYKARLLATEPLHVKAVLDLANTAYRHPLTTEEQAELRNLYTKLRAQELSHEEAIRLMIARVLVSPAFLYRAENPGPGKQQMPVNDWELATRMSYFLWSSMPDDKLRNAAAAGQLKDPEARVAQMQRMLRDDRSRRLAVEFACQWLHVRDFDSLDEKSEKQFPTFTEVRGPMYEEAIQFFTDLFKNNGSVLSILDADHTFLNETLARHYGIPDVKGEEWRRVDGVKRYSRGGVLGFGTTLAKQSGASRTSPILRGNWVAEVLLGDRLPRPPKDVPRLPEDDGATELTVRQLTEKHSEDPRCSGCHLRIDGFGFALERFDAIGRLRERDSVNRPIDTHAKLLDGTAVEGAEGLRSYLLNKRRDAFLRQFSRKLLGFALGRGVQLSDEPLLREMQTELAMNQYQIWPAIETIVRSRQFQDIRGKEMTYED